MGLNKNITVFPQLFLKEAVKKLYNSFEYFNIKVVNKDLDVPYKNYYSFKLVPEYFKLSLRNSNYKVKKIPQYNWGYSILLNNVNSTDDYLQSQFNGKKRSIIKRYVNRLESCFTIQYKFYHGDISKENYNFIMESLYNMITRRFKELNDTHKNIKEWDFLLKNTYDKIIKKTASLFVIYDNEKPLEISLNYHYDKILFSYVSSYNIDYSKFGLGHIEIVKQLEWCIENNYILFEMGVGGTDYKRRWSNNIYRYYHYIIYSKKSIILGSFNTLKYRLKEYLKSKKTNEIPLKFLSKLKTQSTLSNNTISSTKIMDIDKNMNTKIPNISEVNYNDDSHVFIRKHVFDFLYTAVENINNIKVYKLNAKEYLIKGKNKYKTVQQH